MGSCFGFLAAQWLPSEQLDLSVAEVEHGTGSGQYLWRIPGVEMARGSGVVMAFARGGEGGGGVVPAMRQGEVRSGEAQ